LKRIRKEDVIRTKVTRLDRKVIIRICRITLILHKFINMEYVEQGMPVYGIREK